MATSPKARKRTKAYYGVGPAKRKKHGRRTELGPGMQGVLITSNDQEKLCVSEAYSLLNEYADRLYGPESPLQETPTGKGPSDDIESALAREVEGLKGKGDRLRRFQACSTGANYLVFIQCREPVDPCELVHFILSDMATAGIRKSRFCQRMIPVVKVCHASLADIGKEAESVLAPHFHQDDLQEATFAVNYKCRHNGETKRDDVIQLLAAMVTRNGDYGHRVDLNHPELAVMVEIIKTLCCLSVVRDFRKLQRYNVQSVSDAAVSKLAQKGEASGKEDKLPLPASTDDSLKPDHTEEELPSAVDGSGTTCT